ncbi:hypothetical protein DCCM_2433 [Desulfocucumis palustris]|uniref:Uncharacterized protein n=1 Tax=Desulfocucumis palustris TaxID=1898651 RepID=A0A2L2XBH5_9FIRM|nr:hypothetical protein [Desulfocucumis palustris]GBF33334.1 hypothetical protein DCCM_2433 [Desulfocucumis palustris]
MKEEEIGFYIVNDTTPGRGSKESGTGHCAGKYLFLQKELGKAKAYIGNWLYSKEKGIVY